MVATMENLVDVVMGRAQVDPQTLQPEDWEAIINAAIPALTLGYGRGLESLQQMLRREGNAGGEKFRDLVDTEMVRCGMGGVSPNALYINCGEPIIRPLYEDWPVERIYKQYPPYKVYKLFTSSRLVFSRKGEFHVVDITWRLRDLEWYTHSHRPSKRECVVTYMGSSVEQISDVIRSYPDRPIGLMVLRGFRHAMDATEHALRAQLMPTAEGRKTLDGMLQRLGAKA